MSGYILILIWLGVCAWVAERWKLKKKVLVCGVEEERHYWLFAIIVFLPIIIMAATRGDFSDTVVYRTNFIKVFPDNFSDLAAYLPDVDKDKGFIVFASIIKMIIGPNDVLYFFIIAAIQGVIIASVYRKYSSNYVLSVFLFVASADYIGWMFNGIRQFLAVTIVFAAAPLIIKRKYVPTILIILLASTIHMSALVMIPIVFIVQGQAWNKKTLMFIIAALLVIVFLGSFTSLLDSALADTQYKDTVSEMTDASDDGANPIRVLVYVLPAIVSFFERKKIKESDNTVINICTNMSIMAAGFYIVSMFISGIIAGRLPIYCSLYSYILLPWEIEHLFKDKVKSFAYIALVGGYLAYYYYQMHMTWGLF